MHWKMNKNNQIQICLARLFAKRRSSWPAHPAAAQARSSVTEEGAENSIAHQHQVDTGRRRRRRRRKDAAATYCPWPWLRLEPLSHCRWRLPGRGGGGSGGGGGGGSRAGSVAAAPPSLEPRICSSGRRGRRRALQGPSGNMPPVGCAAVLPCYYYIN